MCSYALDNAAAETADRFTALEFCYDAATEKSLRQTGLTTGWSCLEIGAGGGSIALWLSGMAGAGGRVTVTDIAPAQAKPELLTRAGVRVLRHDVVEDALPEAEFDLVHARLVRRRFPESDPLPGVCRWRRPSTSPPPTCAGGPSTRRPAPS